MRKCALIPFFQVMSMNKKRIFGIVAAVIFSVAVIGAGIYSYDRNKDFPMAEKNSFAMGTIVSQKFYGDFAAKQIEKGNLMILALENVISRNIPTSEISELNENGIIRDKEIAQLLLRCKEISAKTDGGFDVTVGKIVDLWNFDGENNTLPDPKKLASVLADAGDKALSINGTEIKLSRGAEVDLGAVGKGLACDKVIGLYKADPDCKGAIVSVGGSIGCFGKSSKAGDGWKIGIRHPRNENSFLGILRLDEGFVSTSGDYEKFFINNEKRYHHILDATTGYPADSGIISVTVICKSGFLSDALSTACLILGKEKGAELLEEYDASAIFVDEALNITTVGEVDFEKH